ncbi:hypothetical protein [Aquiflexum sp.]|uniref:hypothetical protein n=1 Tax=Aquiflexum sp. TaxID=1872584 RepID=UPI003593E69F
MESTKKLTNLQLELLKIFRFDLSDKQLKEIKSILVAYIADNVSNEVDKLFVEQDWGEDKIEAWSKEHLRTKYKN